VCVTEEQRDVTIAQLEHVTVRLGRNEVLRDISWSVPEGDGFVVLRGRSGAGKTTLLHVLSGAVRPTAGEVIVLGVDLMRATAADRRQLRRSRLAHVYQDFRLVPELTAAENVALPLWLRGLAVHEASRAAGAALEAVDLGTLADRLPRQLSGGEQQRVALARVIAVEPRLILADEPSANLDDESTRLIERLLRTQVELGRAVVVATHDHRLYGTDDLVFDLDHHLVRVA
jgi:ABC-type lipoprotein export system ATPase subunit